MRPEFVLQNKPYNGGIFQLVDVKLNEKQAVAFYYLLIGYKN